MIQNQNRDDREKIKKHPEKRRNGSSQDVRKRSASPEIKDKQVQELRERLFLAAAMAADTENLEMDNVSGTELSKLYGTSDMPGRAVYKSFSDEELLNILRERTGQLGHVPAQKEVFWIYRNYLRQRFEKWPYALKKAGLSTKAGKGGMTVREMQARNERYYELMELVGDKAKELGRPPHMFEMEDLLKELKAWFMTWAEVLDAAGVDRGCKKKGVLYKVKNFTDEEKRCLAELKKLSEKLGRAPLRSEIPDEIRTSLNKCCGTWRNALYQIGLEPVIKIRPFGNTYLDRGREQQKKHRDVLENSLYKLVEPDEQTQKMLEEVKAIADRLGRAPVKGEIPSRTFSCLIKKCTTYRNILYQLDLEPLDKNSMAQVKAMLRNKQKTKPTM